MSGQDFTTFTEVDANGKLTVAADKLTGADIDRDEDVYCYLDCGADHFDQIDIDFDIQIESSSQDSAFGAVGLTVSAVGDRTDFGTGDIVAGAYRQGSADYRIYLQRGNGVALDYGAISAGTTYYCTLARAAGSDDVVLYIYSDSGQTALVDTLSVSGYSINTRYRYLYGMLNINSGAGNMNWDGFVQNMLVHQYATPAALALAATVPTPSIQSYDTRVKLHARPRDIRLAARVRNEG